MIQGEYLPIKVVFKRDEDYQAPEPSGAQWEPFCEVTNRLRNAISDQISEVRAYFEQSFQVYRNVPAVAKVSLKELAVAKTYRPTAIFNPNTCPIIGANRLGELYVSALPSGLDRLQDAIQHTDTLQGISHISTINSIKPFTTNDALAIESKVELDKKYPRNERTTLRFRLFRHNSERVNRLIDSTFEKLISDNGIQEHRILNYADGVRVYRLKDVPTSKLMTLARFVGTQSVSAFPSYKVVYTQARLIGTIDATNFPSPVPGIEYGVVGIVDSGTDPRNKHLQAWVVGRYDHVPLAMQNNDHGTFVAGLLAQGRALNHNNPLFPSVSSKIIDVVAFDKSGRITEEDLIDVIDEALKRFPRVKVWNLSLGLDEPCTDHEFSLFGAALDQRSRDQGVLFVIAAGNYIQTPLRSWPPLTALGEDDRICPPADALRSITVGSIAHLENSNTCARQHDPSPFSRRGPGPAYVVKPEVSHFGGNCAADGTYTQTGVISVFGPNSIAENIGTSFATPLVSTVAANLHKELNVAPGAAPPTLVKALLIHGAFVNGVPIEAERFKYSGLGIPAEIGKLLNCTQSSATLILQVPIQTRPVYGKRPFPMPKSMTSKDGFRGEIFMTLLYEPPLDRGFGIEYCRCNISASLGTVEQNASTGEYKYTRRVEPYPKALTEGFEKDLFQHGYKWSPLKLYYRKFSRGDGPVGLQWRLTLETLERSGVPRGSQYDVFLVVTIRTNNKHAKVYNELVTEMDRLGWAAQDLKVKSLARLRP